MSSVAREICDHPAPAVRDEAHPHVFVCKKGSRCTTCWIDVNRVGARRKPPSGTGPTRNNHNGALFLHSVPYQCVPRTGPAGVGAPFVFRHL